MLQRVARLRQAETGEKYTAARRAVMTDPAEFGRLKAMIRFTDARRRYPSTGREGLDRRHVLSAFETSRRAH
jgi:hypothetical protein